MGRIIKDVPVCVVLNRLHCRNLRVVISQRRASSYIRSIFITPYINAELAPFGWRWGGEWLL